MIVNNKDVPLKIFVHSTYWTEEHFLPHLNRYPNSVIIDDAYYYLSGIDFTAAHPNTMVYVTGTEFMPMPGEYRLPYAQGRYVISNGMVTMTTSGSGLPYVHPLCYVNHHTDFYSSGWATFFRTKCKLKNFKVTPVWTPPCINFFQNYNSQKSWVSDALQKHSDIVTKAGGVIEDTMPLSLYL